jgi:hypothetical protein
MDESLLFWVGQTRIEGLSVRGAHQLIEHFGSPQAAYMASLTELESCSAPARVAQAIFAQAGLKDAEKEVREVAKVDGRLIVADSERYPPLLKQIPDAPLLLYVRGERHYALAKYWMAEAAMGFAGPGALLIFKKRQVDALDIEFASERGGIMEELFRIPKGPARPLAKANAARRHCRLK